MVTEVIKERESDILPNAIWVDEDRNTKYHVFRWSENPDPETMYPLKVRAANLDYCIFSPKKNIDIFVTAKEIEHHMGSVNHDSPSVNIPAGMVTFALLSGKDKGFVIQNVHRVKGKNILWTSLRCVVRSQQKGGVGTDLIRVGLAEAEIAYGRIDYLSGRSQAEPVFLSHKKLEKDGITVRIRPLDMLYDEKTSAIMQAEKARALYGEIDADSSTGLQEGVYGRRRYQFDPPSSSDEPEKYENFMNIHNRLKELGMDWDKGHAIIYLVEFVQRPATLTFQNLRRMASTIS